LALGVLAAAGPCWAGFLDASDPVQASALGGNLVAFPHIGDAPFYNAATLACIDHYDLSARYQQLFAGLPGDDLANEGLYAQVPLQGLGGLGLFWDHFGADLLEQDRFKVSTGMELDPAGLPGTWSLGLSAAYLRQAFTPSAPIEGVGAGQLASQAFSMDVGVLARPWSFLSLGASCQDMNQPNLGVFSADQVPRALRWGLGLGPVEGLQATLAQSLSAGLLQYQAGLQWTLAKGLLALRVGVNSTTAGAGFGVSMGALGLDYAYNWSYQSLGQELLPGNQSVALSYAWSQGHGLIAVWRGRAQEAEASGQWSTALLCYQELLALDPKDAEAQAGRTRATLALRKQQAQTYFTAGQTAAQAGMPAEAAKEFQKAQELDPSNPAYAAAYETQREALPSGGLADARVQKQLAAALDAASKGRRDEALMDLQPALDLYPTDPALLDLKATLQAGNRPQSARRRPVNAQEFGWMEEAEAYAGKGQTDLARQAWKRVLSVDPDNDLARRAVQSDDARKQEAPVNDKARQESKALSNQALAAYQKGDLKEAVRLWRAALEADPGNLNAANNLVRARIELKDYH
jgi:tetratricopeptide (TPR) repeat protein